MTARNPGAAVSGAAAVTVNGGLLEYAHGLPLRHR
jgi:hypothetical protein